MTSTITVPDFQYAAMYYPEVYEVLIQAMRTNTPEITDEDEAEPYIQMLRSVALGSHLNTVLLDMVAKEGFLPTAKLRASVKRLLALIDYDLAQASPAAADLVIKLNGTVITATQITAIGAQFSTPSTADTPAIPYEDTVGKIVQRTDQLLAALAYDKTGDAWTDHTTAANTGSSTWSPGWGAAPEVGDLMYFIHGDVQWDEVSIYVNTDWVDVTAALEYYDGHTSTLAPDLVTNQGSDLRLDINAFLGSVERTDAIIRVACPATGASEDLTSQWDGSDNYIVTTAFLGQVSPSLIEADYVISAAWREVDNLVAITPTAPDTHTWAFDLPQTLTRQWLSTTINSVVGYPMRFRVCAVGGAPAAPTWDTVDIDADGIYLVRGIAQGVTRKDDPLGSSTGLPDQTFTLVNFPVIDDVSLRGYVDEGSGAVEYYRQPNFLSSLPIDRHFTVEFNDVGQAEFTFGNGDNGKIPPAGVDNVTADYRTMDEVDGNVGANAITQNQSGSGYISDVWNPRPAAGYQAREGSTAAGLKVAKETGVASLRTGSTAASPGEVETLTVAFTDSTGTRPFSRCLAIEEGFGPKTIEAVVVAAGGAAATVAQLAELEAYFNSDTPNKVYGVLVSNHEATGSNYAQKVIPVTATVYGGSKTSVETALAVLLDPEATDDEGDWLWDFGEEVPLSVIITAIMTSTPPPRKVVVTTPAGDTSLATKELPRAGTLAITPVP